MTITERLNEETSFTGKELEMAVHIIAMLEADFSGQEAVGDVDSGVYF
jgi:hypothetical protein